MSKFDFTEYKLGGFGKMAIEPKNAKRCFKPKKKAQERDRHVSSSLIVKSINFFQGMEI